MLLYELICESRSADLYHGTNMTKLTRMLHDNVLVAQTPIHSEVISKKFKGLTRTVSLTRNAGMATNFARSKAGGEQGIDGIPVVIVLDQEKLHRKLGRRMQPYNDLASLAHSTERAAGGGEYEEVVFGSINDLNSYIKNIIVHINPNVKKENIKDFNKAKIVFDDPRTVVVDFLNKNLTGRQFMQLAAQKQNASVT